MKLRNVRTKQWRRYEDYLISLPSDDVLAPWGLERQYNKLIKKDRRQAFPQKGMLICVPETSPSRHPQSSKHRLKIADKSSFGSILLVEVEAGWMVPYESTIPTRSCGACHAVPESQVS